jgi:hypothetical protein
MHVPPYGELQQSASEILLQFFELCEHQLQFRELITLTYKKGKEW